MPSAHRPYIAALTGLRGVAAGLVLLYHYAALHPGVRLDLAAPLIGPVLQFPFGLGFAGVDVFFVLSGFLLALPFARANLEGTAGPGLRRYFRRRILRVFPAYYAQLILMLAVGAWFLSWRPLGPAELFAHGLMFFNVGPRPVTPLVGVWWTLPVEFGFYLLLPLLAPLLRPGRWPWLLALATGLSIVYRGWTGAHFEALGSDRAFLAAVQLPGTLPQFLLGAAAALLAQKADLSGRPHAPAWLLDLGFAGGLTLPALWLWHVVLAAGGEFWLGHWSMLVSPVAIGLPLATAILCVYLGSRLGRLLLANRAIYTLGLISYSLYLWHFVVMQQLQHAWGVGYAELPHSLSFPLAVGAALAVAALSYWAVERPFYRLKSWPQLRRARSQPGE